MVDYFLSTLAYFTGDYSSQSISCNRRQYTVAATVSCYRKPIYRSWAASRWCFDITAKAFAVGDTCVSLSTQYGATLSRQPAKSGEQRRLSTAIALGINARTYRSAHFMLDNRRPCILRDRSSGVEYLDTVRAVFWVCCNFSTSPEDWTVLALLPRLTISVNVQRCVTQFTLQPWSR